MLLQLTTFLFFYQIYPLPDLVDPLKTHQVAVTDDGHLYILDVYEAQIIHLEEDGAQHEFSHRGRGPGELNNPWSVFVEKDQVYVVDFLKGILTFDRHGNFKKLITMPQQYIRPVKVKNGWVYTKDPLDSNQSSSLFWCDEEGEKQEKLTTYVNGIRRVHIDVKGNTVYLDFNPAVDNARLLPNKSGDQLFFYAPDSTKIVVYDLDKKKIVKEIDLHRPRRPFDKSWGESKVEEIENNTYLNGQKVKSVVIPKFPEYFPVVVNMFWGPDQSLWIKTDESYFIKNSPLLIFSQEGQPLNSIHQPFLSDRLVATIDQHAFILAYNREKEHPMIIKSPKNKINFFVEKFPNSMNENSEETMYIDW
jgi:hypothetical protein